MVMEMEKAEPGHYAQRIEEHGREIIGFTLLTILVIGVFQPLALSGIPVLFAFVTFLGGLNIVAGVTGLLIAVIVNIAYLAWKLSGPVRNLFNRLKKKL